MKHLWLRTAAYLLAALVIALIAGVALEPALGWALFSVLVVGLLLYHVKNMNALAGWLAGKDTAPVPVGEGVWEEIFTSLYHRRKEQIRRRGRVARLLARSMQAGRALPYGVTVLDPDLRIVWCNDSAKHHFSIDGDRDRGQPVANLVRQPEFRAYLDARQFNDPLELESTVNEGIALVIQMVAFVESHYLLLSRDVTQARKIQLMRRDFVANVSHELRTPLTVLIGFLETLRDHKLDAQRSSNYLGLMSEQGARMQRIIDDLLMLSTLESAPPPPANERVDVPALLAQVLSDAQALSSGNHELTLDVEPGLALRGDAGELTSAFTNLANNAVRYTPKGGSVRLSWRSNEDRAEFVVEDNGIGIAPEHIPRLTERFYRVDRGRSRETGGTGLGLAIVKHVLARHQATLHVESTPGRGSRFTARFSAPRVARIDSARGTRASGASVEANLL